MSEPEPIDEQKPEPMSGHDSLDELLAEKPASQKSDIEEKESLVEEEAKVPAVEPESGDQTSHLFAVRTTGGQEKIVMRLLETKMRMDREDEENIKKAKEEGKEIKKIGSEQKRTEPEEWRRMMKKLIKDKQDEGKEIKINADIRLEDLKYKNVKGEWEYLEKDWKMTGDLENSQYVDEDFPRMGGVQTVLLLDDMKGYVVLEARDPPSMFNAIQGIRHIRGQLRGELSYSEVDRYIIKKSTVTELSVDNTVEIIGGPFKGMKATVKRVDQEKEEAVVILLDAPYQLPVTVDANHLKKVLS